MPQDVRCPECRQPLRVADHAVGRELKCPLCGTNFAAVPAVDEFSGDLVPLEEPPAPSATAPLIPEPEARPVPDAAPDEQYQLAPPLAAALPAALPVEETEQPRRRKRSREVAKPRPPRPRTHSDDWAASQVLVPAIGMIAAGGLGVVGCGLLLLLNCAGLARLPANIAPGLYGVVFNLIGVCWGGIMVAGALRFLRLASWGQSLTAAIVACLPGPCCVLSMPFGVWAIILLLNPSIREHFDGFRE